MKFADSFVVGKVQFYVTMQKIFLCRQDDNINVCKDKSSVEWSRQWNSEKQSNFKRTFFLI